MLQLLVDATLALFEPSTFLLVLVGVVLGLIFGVLPGVGGNTAMALLIPVSYGLDTTAALAFLMSTYITSNMGGQVTSILVNIPGDAPNAATTFDGFPMAKQGRAAEAMGAATMGSLIGAIIGTIFIIIMVPIARAFILSFSYPEFFMIALSGLTIVAALTQGQTYKGLIAAGLGLMLSFVGLDPITGNPRFVFGQLDLWDGIDVTPALIGLFAGAEMLSLFGSRKAVAPQRTDVGVQSVSTFWDGIVATFRHWRVVLWSSLIGIWIGVVPGVGGSVGAFLSYGRAQAMSKSPETFGKGNVEGIIASETANDADRGGALLPTVAFGIPGGSGMAILLGALILKGVPAGPNLMREHADIIYLLIMAALIPRFIAAFLVWALGRQLALITRVRGDLLAPIVTVIALVGAYALNASSFDVLLTIIFGWMGYEMKKHNFSRVSLVIGLFLGTLVETAYHQTMATMGWTGFFTRPISLAFFIMAMAVLILPYAATLRRRMRGEKPTATPYQM